jgi:hypothetical protein
MEKKNKEEITIGLFGTCGGSTWRNDFMKEYDKKKISYFNPQVEKWDESMAVKEAEHLSEDEIILFPITSETYGMGSLAETGFSILQAINLEKNRDFVVLIDAVPNIDLKEKNTELYKESCRARALVIQHLKKLKLANLYIVDNMNDMLKVSIVLFDIAKKRKKLRKFFS